MCPVCVLGWALVAGRCDGWSEAWVAHSEGREEDIGARVGLGELDKLAIS